ncbi:MAG TPA: cytidyltransferase, partial [Atribacterota bacterium]|nr:cytidyltransferase [Atribacterota bacterium]
MGLKNQKSEIKEITDKLFQELTRIDVLQKYELDVDDIKAIERNSTFKKNLSVMVNKRKFTAAQTVELYWDRFRSLDESISKEQWLKKIYNYCQYLSFPDTRPELKDLPLSKKKLFFMFLLTYRQVITLKQQYGEKDLFLHQYPLSFLSSREIGLLEQPEEYVRFLNAFEKLFVYEMMALSKEIYQYSTLDHVCGVHALALSIARQIQKQGFSLDFGIVSGSAAGHDVGKYGCRGSEQKRVPYLHYYYTDIWFQQQDISYIGHIAVNHSVWDLELENLSLEALILIYSDFRVKNKLNSNEMNIYSLQESFRVILNKLDNVDENKEKRYRKVFAKLKDFEDFLIKKGLNVDLILLPEKKYHLQKKQLFFALLHGDEVIQQIKHLSLEHSFRLMFQLRNESSINSILESARSEGDWQNLQEYLRIFAEYASYLNQNEKILTLKYLYEQLVFPEEGIRRRSAKLIGYLIATFDEKYRKEIPVDVFIEPSKVKSTDLLEKYIQLLIEPIHKTSELNQCRVRENLPFLFDALFKNSQGRQIEQYLQIIKNYYQQYNHDNVPKIIAIYLLQAIKSIPILPQMYLEPVFANF